MELGRERCDRNSMLLTSLSPRFRGEWDIRMANIFLVLCNLENCKIIKYILFFQPPSKVGRNYYYCVVVSSFYRLVALRHWANRCWSQNSNLGLLTVNPTVLPRPHSFLPEHLAQDFLLLGDRDLLPLILSMCKLILFGAYGCKGLELSQVNCPDGVRIRTQVILSLIN